MNEPNAAELASSFQFSNKSKLKSHKQCQLYHGLSCHIFVRGQVSPESTQNKASVVELLFKRLEFNNFCQQSPLDELS